jgi:hypothetical protein
MERGWLEREFTAALVDWRRKLDDDEWYFAHVRNRLTDSLSPEEAFNAIDEAVNVTLAQDDESLWTEAMYLILSLANRSDTTEMPPELSERWAELMASAARFGTYQRARAEELRRWYRR